MPIVNPSGSPIVPATLAMVTVSLYSDVRALLAGQASRVEVLGGSTVGDGQDGVFYWNSTSTAADDGFATLAPNAGGTGRWIRIYGAFKQSGSGAPVITVQAALQDLKAWSSDDTAPSRFYRYDNVFNGTTNHATLLGYNVTGAGQIGDASKAAHGIWFEPDYNVDGTQHVTEFHVDMAVPNGSFLRPFFATMQISNTPSTNNGKIISAGILSDTQITLTAASGDITLASSTITMSGVAAHTGTFLVTSYLFQGTNSSDSSSSVQIGVGDTATGTRTTIRFRNGGWTAPANANALANGDKQVHWNDTTLKIAQGIDAGTSWFQCNGSGASVGFKWFGGTAAGPALHMTLSNAAALTLVGAFGCNGATAQTASTGYGTPTNGAKQSSFDATTITLANLAKATAQLIIDLKAIGFLAA